jgi:hypothetical protein
MAASDHATDRSTAAGERKEPDMRRNLRVRRWLTVPVAAVAMISLAGFDGDGDGKKKKKEKDSKSEPTVLIDEEFVDDRNGWGEATSDRPGVFEVSLVDTAGGELRFGINQYPAGNSVDMFPDALLPREGDLADVGVAADVRWDGPAIPSLLCRTTDDFLAYGFGVRPDGTAVIFKRMSDGELVPLARSDEDEPLFAPEDTLVTAVHITGSCETTKRGAVRLVMGVDGDRVLKTVDSDKPIPSTGLPALTVYQAEEAQTFSEQSVLWDNFVVTEFE